jgi:lysophospholipid acyltransferase (LPLAT)-like uncharacterized protein
MSRSSDHPITRSPDLSRRAVDDSVAFTLRQRFTLWLVSWSVYLLIRLLGSTLRFQHTLEDGSMADGLRHPPPGIYCFWHRAMIASAYHFRNKHIAIMISRSFDGELIARIVEKLGFRPVRGSSSRGGAGALIGMREELELGHPAVFTADGPRGPLYVAKPGPVVLAQKTGYKICCFHVAVERAWILKSWDKMMIPKPFSRAAFYITSPLAVPPSATDEELETWRQQVQEALDRARLGAEAKLSVLDPAVKS